MERLEKLFSFEKVNSGRQPEVDMAKFIAIIILIICHTGIFLADIGTPLYTVTSFLGAEAGAPVFMFCMGLSFCYSKNSSPASMAKRGVRLLISGIILNIIRLATPLAILKYVFQSPGIPEVIQCVFMSDILIFAGLAMLLISLFNKCNISPVVQLLIAILLEALSELVAGRSTGSVVLDTFAGWFVPISELTPFSLFNWLFFPVAGQLFGYVLLRCRDKRALYSMLLPLSGLGALYVHFMTYFDVLIDADNIHYYSAGYYYSMGVKPVIMTLFVIFFMLSISFFLQSHLSEKAKKFVSTTSNNLNNIYIASWIIIAYTRIITLFITVEPLPNWLIILMMPIFFALSWLIARLIENKKKKKKAQADSAGA